MGRRRCLRCIVDLRRAALEQHVTACDQAAFEGCFRTACGQAVFESWGQDDAATQAALDLLDFGNDLLQAAGPSKLPSPISSGAPAASTAPDVLLLIGQPGQQPLRAQPRQPIAFWQGPAGSEMAKYLTMPACSPMERDRSGARVKIKAQPKAEPSGKAGVKRKKSAEAAPAKKQRTAGKKTLAKGLPRAVQMHFAVLLSYMDATVPSTELESSQVQASPLLLT